MFFLLSKSHIHSFLLIGLLASIYSCSESSTSTQIDDISSSSLLFISSSSSPSSSSAILSSSSFNTIISSSILYSSSQIVNYCEGMEWDSTSQFCDTRDGHLYRFVTIGSGDSSQVWMAENLAWLPALGRNTINKLAYYVYNVFSSDTSLAKSSNQYTIYGVLYNHYAAIFSCPSGWHLPTHEEWQILLRNSGDSLAGNHLRANTEWTNTSESMHQDLYGFSALPGGYSMPSAYYYLNEKALWWTSTYTTYFATYYRIDDGYTGLYWATHDRDNGLSVRCIRD